MNKSINSINRSNANISLTLPNMKTSYLMDDIDPQEWLNEIDLIQYAETFKTNLTIGGSVYLSRKKLGQIKMHHLSNMNITNFDHQKIIIDHIQHTLKFPFQSPVRRREVEAKHSSNKTSSIKFDELTIDTNDKEDIKGKKGGKGLRANDMLKRGDHSKQPAPGRRRSFDHNVWDSIAQMRNTDASAVNALREGVGPDNLKKKNDNSSQRRRRWSFDEDLNPSSHSERGKLFGNRALEFDIMVKELKLLQDNHLNKYKNLIKCEKAKIIFCHDKSKELIEYNDGVWYRLPAGMGISGHCAETGETINVRNAYEDLRFNKNVDIKTGYKTKTILCQPLRSHRGGGHIIGVIEMTNKVGADYFDEHDAELLATCVQRISDELNARFKDLLHAAEMFSGSALFIGEKGGGNYSPSGKPIWEKMTKSAIHGRYEPDRSERGL
jgi:hypothetical protein